MKIVLLGTRSVTLSIVIACMISLAVGCRGRAVQPETPDTGYDAGPMPAVTDMSIKDPLLPKTYRAIVVEPFQADELIIATYPDAVRDCQKGIIATLDDLKAYIAVAADSSNATSDGALRIRGRINNVRLAIWFAKRYRQYGGSSWMDVDLYLVDASTNAVVREKKIVTANNAWGAKWSDSDETLPADVGVIIAEYVHSVIPH